MIERILQDGDQPAFALISRAVGSGQAVDVLQGAATVHNTLSGIASPEPAGSQLIIVPYQQLAERGLAHHPDGAELIALDVLCRTRLTISEASEGPTFKGSVDGDFDLDDATYANIVQAVIRDEISTGQGANFVIARSFQAELPGFDTATAVALFRSLLQQETGAYWTFLVHWKGHYLVGASPEKHITSVGGEVEMNPISGTYSYPDEGITGAGIFAFLNDAKETDELRMVVDEELKMMSQFCPDGATAYGPDIKWMARLAHTEYTLRGRSDWKFKDLLRATMFAPTIIGSPLENATRVVQKYEPVGRGYYSGVLGLVETDAEGKESVDSCILIRAAHINGVGALRLTVGATLVRHSDPMSEVAETAAKASSILHALSGKAVSARLGKAVPPLSPQEFGKARQLLEAKNAQLSTFWTDPVLRQPANSPDGPKVLVIDAEDAFTQMLKQQIQALGASTAVIRYSEDFNPGLYDLVVCGPGPGNPNNDEDPKVRRMTEIIRGLLVGDVPFMAVCLSHQILCRLLTLKVEQKETPNQGLQAEIGHFGARRTVGFYNAFSGIAHPTNPPIHPLGTQVHVSANPETGEIHGLQGDNFTSTQFHPESILSLDGLAILQNSLNYLLDQPEPEPLKG
ncbi:anthranilate synthase family protein [Arthrobacter sp. ISL-48]|uniref:anthranilate synthase family protein n=1 Tax=Arthrobacter sp. ISL-48 TaxID=2819110 RepID=UPI001BE827DA|nr:anthranilate synthase family protein [Arthrobacter sp. ISL-48]